MNFIYSTSYWFFSKSAVYFTKLANYFYDKKEQLGKKEEYIFESDDELDDDVVIDLSPKMDTQYDRTILNELKRQDYPANFTSIYIDPKKTTS
jgi:hypothetical protein